MLREAIHTEFSTVWFDSFSFYPIKECLNWRESIDGVQRMDPVTLAAGAIAKIAFDEFAKVGAGEAAKGAVEGAITLIGQLRDRIRVKFQENKKAEIALEQLKKDGSPSAMTKLEVYLDDAMTEDPSFAEDIRQIAQQIINLENQSFSSRDYNNYGRDQINIENIQGNPRIGGS